jgi:hypothetical protein
MEAEVEVGVKEVGIGVKLFGDKVDAYMLEEGAPLSAVYPLLAPGSSFYTQEVEGVTYVAFDMGTKITINGLTKV